jgi:cytochrome c oxidase subunit III
MSDAHSMTAGTHVGRHHAHHFDSAEDEFEACKQGMWLFLVTEVLMIGGLFVAFGVFRGLYHDAFLQTHKLLSVKMGAINTVVLITSSLTMVLGVTATQRGQKDRAVLFHLATLFLAACFLVVKYFEYTHKFHTGILPGGFFNPEGADAALKSMKGASIFISLYFIMTGIHGLHVVIGMGLIAWVLLRTLRNEFGPDYYTPVELVGFYWHFVDLVWIYLFPLLYLIG